MSVIKSITFDWDMMLCNVPVLLCSVPLLLCSVPLSELKMEKLSFSKMIQNVLGAELCQNP
jgi:hypothetical protein